MCSHPVGVFCADKEVLIQVIEASNLLQLEPQVSKLNLAKIMYYHFFKMSAFFNLHLVDM